MSTLQLPISYICFYKKAILILKILPFLERTNSPSLILHIKYIDQNHKKATINLIKITNNVKTSLLTNNLGQIRCILNGQVATWMYFVFLFLVSQHLQGLMDHHHP